VRELYSMLKPGGELRYLEHVAGVGLRGTLQKAADATVWPRLLGNCHTHRNTEASISAAGFSVDGSRREQTLPGWLPIPVSEFAIGRAVRP
jgi:predicted methyltransferase